MDAKQEELERVNRATQKITQILQEENCRAEAVLTFFGSKRISSEVQVVANPRVAKPVENPSVEVQSATQPTQEGGVN